MEFEVGNKRTDGKFNVWKLNTTFSEFHGFSEFWSIIKVFPSEAAAHQHCNWLKKQYDPMADAHDRA